MKTIRTVAVALFLMPLIATAQNELTALNNGTNNNEAVKKEKKKAVVVLNLEIVEESQQSQGRFKSIDGTKIILRNMSDETITDLTTDKEGKVILTLDKQTKYNITLKKDGFKQKSISITTKDLQYSEEHYAVLALSKISDGIASFKEDEIWNSEEKEGTVEEKASLIFTVHFARFRKGNESKVDVEDYKVRTDDEYSTYMKGEFLTFEGALPLLKELKSKGYSDAFIAAYKGKERVSTSMARHSK